MQLSCKLHLGTLLCSLEVELAAIVQQALDVLQIIVDHSCVGGFKFTVTRSSQIEIFLASPILLVPYMVNLYLLN